MAQRTYRGLNPNDRSPRSDQLATDYHPQADRLPSTCPTCGRKITGVSATGPGQHAIEPCGHTLPRLVTDGGQDAPEQLPAEAYRITAEAPPTCFAHDGDDAPDAVWRVDFTDTIGDSFIAVCTDEECLDAAADHLESVEVLPAGSVDRRPITDGGTDETFHCDHGDHAATGQPVAVSTDVDSEGMHRTCVECASIDAADAPDINVEALARDLLACEGVRAVVIRAHGELGVLATVDFADEVYADHLNLADDALTHGPIRDVLVEYELAIQQVDFYQRTLTLVPIERYLARQRGGDA